MLFLIKNHLVPALVLAAVFAATAIGIAPTVGLPRELPVPGHVVLAVLLGLAAVVASDVLLFGLLRALRGDRFLASYRRLMMLFRPQRPATIIASGVLAASEELVFRGLLVGGLMVHGVHPVAAVLLVAAIFGAAHDLPHRQMGLFLAWSVWEGILLGSVFVVSGSLLVVMIVHALHDVGGFTLFAYQRRTGWMTGSRPGEPGWSEDTLPPLSPARPRSG